MEMNSTKFYMKGILFCLIATVSWGIMFPVMTQALLKIDPFSFTALRYSLAGVIFLLYLYMKEGKSSFQFDGKLLLLWVFGSAGFAGFGFFVFLGQQLAGPEGALSASMMMATMPFLGLFVAWVLKAKRPPLYSFFFIALSLLGVLLVITKGDLALIVSVPGYYVANLLMLAGALCWVIYTVGATYFQSWSPIRYTALTTICGLPTIYLGVLLSLIFGFIELPSIAVVWQVFPELIYMSLVAGFVGVLCWNQGNKILTPLNGVLFMDVVPITAFVLSTIEGVLPTSGQLLGVLFTATALIFNNLYQRQKMEVNGLPASTKN
jgi:drug/metabolite transporter (DMT)-like permease